MVRGSKKPDIITYEEVLRMTGGGYDIYMAYEGKVEKKMKRPWGTDRNPSWGIFCRNGVWFWSDRATEESGTAIEYMQKKFGLNFGDCMKKLVWDFGWGEEKINASPIKVVWERKKEEQEPIHITFDTQPFKKKHHEFWNIAEVTERDCNKLECWAVKTLVVKRRIFRFKPDEIVFAYYAPELKKVKIYFPEREKNEKFLNNVPYFYLWNIRNVQKCNDVIVQKSYKDLIVTSLITPCIISTQAEAVQIFNEETVQTINSLADNVWVWYGSDDDGVKKCKEITNTNKWKYINTPKMLLPDVNDNYGFVRMHNLKNPGTGIKKLEEFMKSKKFPTIN